MFKILSSRTWKPIGWLSTLFLLAFIPSQTYGQCVIEFTSCPPATVTIPDCDADGMEALTWTVPTATVTSNGGATCGTVNVTQTGGPILGASESLGSHAITYTAQVIENGSVIVTKTCNFNAVIVADVDPPVITCPANLTVAANASCAGTVPNLTSDVTVMDICPTTVVQSVMAGTTFGTADGATQSITFTATDGSGNSAACSMTVTSKDSMPPSLTCPADISVDTDAGTCSAVAPSLGSPMSSDNCGASASPVAMEPTYALGENTVTWTLTDDAGNSSSCDQKVTIEDNEAPMVTTGTIDTHYTDSSTAEMAAISATTYSDNCTMSPTVTSSESFSGCTATFTVTVTDGAGNSASASYMTVIDGDGPDISALTGLFDGQEYGCGDNIIGDLSELEQLAIDDGFVSDVCSGMVTVVAVEDTTAGVCAGNFSVERTATYSDEYGNTSDLVYTYTVSDEDGPRIDNDANELDYSISCDDMNLGSGSATLDPLEQAPTASDACGSAVTITEEMALYSETPAMGAYTITRTWTTMDACGNSGSGYTQVITVIDTLAPTFDACQDLTVSIGSDATLIPSGTCDGSIPDFSGAAVTDNCMTSDSITVSQDVSGSISVTHNGTTVVTLTADDNQGNSSTCQQMITWKDVTAPTLTCMDVTVSADVNCEATSASLSGTTATDNCTASVTLTNNSSSVAPYQLGDNTVTFTATDDAGNSSNCSINVEVLDVTAPTITCPSNVTVSADNDCEYDMDLLTDATATDNCDASVDIDNGCSLPTLLPSCTLPLGPNTVIWTATDNADNSSSCTQMVTVEDDTAPTVICPSDISIDTDPSSCDFSPLDSDYYLDGFEMAANISDNCTSFGDFTITHNGPMTMNLGENVITYTVTDESSNSESCTMTITVEDNEDPMITCPADITVDADANCSANPTLGSPSSSDNCTANNTITFTTPTYVLGDNDVTWSATDAANNSASCTQKVTVVDNTAPSITCPSNVTVNTDMDMCTYASSSLSGASAMDNCTSMLNITSDAAPDLTVGTTTINWNVQDEAFNSSACSQQVTVVDAQAPTISCPADVTIDADANCQGQTMLSATAMDNCPSPTVSDDAPAMFGLGMTTVNFSVVDGSNNSAACSMTVTVQDVTAPTASVPTDGADITGYTCGSTVMVDADNSACIATRTLSKPTFSDNCDMSPTNSSAASGGVHLTNLGFAMLSNFPTGTTTVSFTSVDAAGNSTICTVDIQVVDAQFPVITNCPSNITMANDAGLCAANVSWTAPTASDNCTGVTLTGSAVSPAGSMTSFSGSTASGTSFPVGTYTYTYSATDAGGNTSTCSFDIEVTDSEAPTIACPSDITVSTDAGLCTASGVMLGYPTVMDNCAEPTSTNDGVEPYVVGGNTIVWTATDAASNASTCSQTVTVEETTVWYADTDGDGFGDASNSTVSCTQPLDYVLDDTDCDDTDAAINPGATEVCDGVDNNCDGQIDETGSCDVPVQLAASNITSSSATISWAHNECATRYRLWWKPAGGTWVKLWVDSPATSYNLSGLESNKNVVWKINSFCDGVGATSGFSPLQIFRTLNSTSVAYYPDMDGDSFGDAFGSPVFTQTIGYVLDNTDCDDTDVDVNPNGVEVCDGIDNNCDGEIDEVTTCPAVTGLAVSSITETSAAFTWTGDPCATYYKVQYRLAGGGGPFTSVIVTAPSANVTALGLNPDTRYVVRVRAYCNGAYATLSSLEVFTTLAIVPRNEAIVQNIDQALDVKVSPNPAQDFITVQVAGTTNKPALLTLVDPVGRVVMTREAVIENGIYTSRIDLNNYPTGAYLLRVQSEDETKVVRVMKAGQ